MAVGGIGIVLRFLTSIGLTGCLGVYFCFFDGNSTENLCWNRAETLALLGFGRGART